MTLEDNVAELRLVLGEPVTDSLFTDEQLANWLEGSNSFNEAALKGWRAKAAHFANLVTTVDGASVRNFSDLLTNAQEMVKMYEKLSNGRSGRARIGRIIRSL